MRLGFPANSSIEVASASTSPSGNMVPVTCGMMRSGPHPTLSLTIQGRAQAIASFTTRPHVSPPSEGSTSASEVTYALVICDWFKKPVKRIGTLRSRTRTSHSARNGPSPTIKPWIRGLRRTARSIAHTKSRGRFLRMNFPANMKTIAFSSKTFSLRSAGRLCSRSWPRGVISCYPKRAARKKSARGARRNAESTLETTGRLPGRHQTAE